MAARSRRSPPKPAHDSPDAILASYPPALFGPRSALDTLLGFWTEDAAAQQRKGLELLARSGIRDVPADFDGRTLLLTIDYWKHELREWEIGPEPPAAERDALETVGSAAQRLTQALYKLTEEASRPASRIAESVFTRDWPKERLDALRLELARLRDSAFSPEVAATMRRQDRPQKPKGGWSARESFFGYDLPQLYQATLKRRFTVSRKPNGRASEGIRFACTIASEVLGHQVTAENVIKQRQRFNRAIKGGQQGRE